MDQINQGSILIGFGAALAAFTTALLLRNNQKEEEADEEPKLEAPKLTKVISKTKSSTETGRSPL